MTAYQKAIHSLASHQYTWLITGVAGFIGSSIEARSKSYWNG